MNTMIQNNDVTIIGAGFAGLACARVAAAKGLKTLVLERKPCPGANMRTTGILVNEAANIMGLPAHLGRKIGGVRLYAPSGKSVDLSSPGYSFVATDTPGMMRWLDDRASMAGADVRCNQNVAGFSQIGKEIALPSQGMRTRFLVGCDGARSNVARHFNLGKNEDYLMGAEAEYEGVSDLDLDRLHVFIDSKLAPGYIGWVVPGVGITQVGIAVKKSHKPDLASFEDRVKKVFDFSKAKVVGRRGGLIPCGGVVKNWQRDNVMLLGDSAGMVSPLTAGGIHPSMEIGAEAGDAIANHLLNDAVHPASVIQPMIPSYGTKGVMRWAMDHLQPPNLVCNMMLGNPIFRRIAQVVFFHHRGLLSPDAWRDILSLKAHHAAPSST
jgi:digeranylgeranylglycerophospholipid reductase